jgi:phage tail P2-like protein
MSDRLLPPSATPFVQAMERAAGCRISAIPTPMRSMWNPNTCPDNVLPWLAWAFDVDQWDPTWSDAQKRAVINAAYSVAAHKGTIGAVQNALNALGVGITIIEWFNDTPVGEPYTFRIVVQPNADVSEELLQQALTLVGATKNLRSQLTGLTEIISDIDGSLCIAAVQGQSWNYVVGSGDLPDGVAYFTVDPFSGELSVTTATEYTGETFSIDANGDLIGTSS